MTAPRAKVGSVVSSVAPAVVILLVTLAATFPNIPLGVD